MLYLAIAASIAATYDIVHNQFVKLTSSMNMAIMGNTKLALLVILSMLTLEATPTPTRIAGVCTAFAGVVWYSTFKLLEPKKPAKTSDETGEQQSDKTAPLVGAEKGEKPTEASALIKK